MPDIINAIFDSVHTTFYYKDTLNSEYELHCGDDFEKGTLIETGWAFRDYCKRFNSVLYSGKPWYAFLWVTPNVNFGPTYVTKWNCFRDSSGFGFFIKDPTPKPKTGEEVRLIMWKPILLGTKGLFYGKGKYNLFCNNNVTGYTNPVIDTISLSGDFLVYCDIIGGDYINLGDTNTSNERKTYGFGHWINPNLYCWDTLGIDSNHIYLGLKSTRAETMELHRWIEAAEDTLLKLNLLACYDKGIFSSNQIIYDTSFYSQSPKIATDTLLSKFVHIHKVKTKRIDNSVYDNDSLKAFFLSLFSFDNDTFNDTANGTTFYIGVLNPRTDPLVRTFDTVKNPNNGSIPFIDSSMKFYSTAEYDIGVRYGNYTHTWNPITNSYEWRDTSYWRSLWWKRQGCREIQIPLITLIFPFHSVIVVSKLFAFLK